jgi:hypothetical protein
MTSARSRHYSNSKTEGGLLSFRSRAFSVPLALGFSLPTSAMCRYERSCGVAYGRLMIRHVNVPLLLR